MSLLWDKSFIQLMNTMNNLCCLVNGLFRCDACNRKVCEKHMLDLSTLPTKSGKRWYRCECGDFRKWFSLTENNRHYCNKDGKEKWG